MDTEFVMTLSSIIATHNQRVALEMFAQTKSSPPMTLPNRAALAGILHYCLRLNPTDE